MFKTFFIIPFFWGLGQAQAHEAEDGRIYLSLGSFTHQTQFKHERGEAKAPVQGSAGFIVNGDLSPKGSLEVGGFYLNKVFMRERGPDVLVEKAHRVYMTIGYRHWFDSRFSIAVASFTSYSMGEGRRLYSTTGGDPGFKTSAADSSDHGLDYSVLYEFYSDGKNSAFADIRYSRSLSGREGEDSDHLGLYLAYKIRTK